MPSDRDRLVAVIARCAIKCDELADEVHATNSEAVAFVCGVLSDCLLELTAAAAAKIIELDAAAAAEAVTLEAARHRATEAMAPRRPVLLRDLWELAP